MARTSHVTPSTTQTHDERAFSQTLAQHLPVVIFFVLATLALVAVSFYVHTNQVNAIDLAASHAVQSYSAGWYDLLMRFTGEPGYPPQVYVLVFWIILVLWFTHLRWEAVMEVFATVGIGVVGLIVKTLVNRARPTPDLVHVMTTLDGGKLSFPAGHVESFMAIIGFLWFLSFVLCKNQWVRTITLLYFGEMLALIGISRIYTGEHWMTDVIGGYLLGTLWLILTIYIYEWGKGRFFTSERKRSG